MQSTLDSLAEWLARQSWYAGSPDGIPRLRELAETFLPSGDATARVRVLLVRDESPDTPVLYQLPLVERDVVDPRVVGVIGSGYGGAVLVDGPSDPAYASALLGALRDAGELRDPADDRYIVSSTLVDDGATATMRIEPYGRPAILARIARVVVPGEDPNAVAARALADVEEPEAPRFVGALPIRWTDEDGAQTAHLAILREDRGTEVDGWARAVEAARAGSDASDDLRRLGAALARTHAALGSLGRRPAAAEEIETMIGAWRSRLAGAVREVPALEAREPAISAVLDEAAGVTSWPELQTIHGAVELAVARCDPDGRWWLTGHAAGDSRPAADRVDLVERDVAGALRSLHYVAELTGVGAEWSERARRALLSGYAVVAGAGSLDPVLLAVFELDFAVLDAVWESRARPAAVGIPVSAIDGLVGDALRGEDSVAA